MKRLLLTVGAAVVMAMWVPLAGAIGPQRPTCDGRLATSVGTNGPDVITGTAGRDVIAGLGGDDQIYGLGQDDIICGAAGDDVLWAGAGNDRTLGGDGDDSLVPGAGTDTLDGGPGSDIAAYWDASGPITASLASGTASGDGQDTFANLEGIHGSSYGDTFSGDATDNELFGLDGNDTLSAGAGNDSLNGGNGDDSLSGEEGNDYLDGADGVDFIDGGPDWDACVNGETVSNCEA